MYTQILPKSIIYVGYIFVPSEKTDQRSYVCDKCNYCLADRTSMRQHLMTSHSNNKPNICPECNRGFARYSLGSKGRSRVCPNLYCSFLTCWVACCSYEVVSLNTLGKFFYAGKRVVRVASLRDFKQDPKMMTYLATPWKLST